MKLKLKVKSDCEEAAARHAFTKRTAARGPRRDGQCVRCGGLNAGRVARWRGGKARLRRPARCGRNALLLISEGLVAQVTKEICRLQQRGAADAAAG